MLRCTAGLASSLLLASCSLLFDESASGLPDGVAPELSFNFETASSTEVRSNGTIPMRLLLSGVAKVEAGGLDLSAVESEGDGNAVATTTAAEFVDACQATEELSISLWMTPGADSFVGKAPARIVSLEEDPDLSGAQTNLVVAQGDNEGTTYNGVTVRSGGDGRSSFVERIGLPLTVGVPVYVGFSMDVGGRYLLLAGETLDVGDLDNGISSWSRDLTLSLGAASSAARPWSGIIHHLDVFCTALSEDDLRARAVATDPR